MDWDPLIDLNGNLRVIKVGASDAAQDPVCGLQLAVKVRPEIGSPAWRRSWSETPFALGPVRDIALRAHDETFGSFADLREFLDRQLAMRPGLHPGLAVYTRAAVENYLDAHDALQADTGPTRLLTRDPKFVVGDRTLTAWTPLYETAAGVREVRRLRMSSARTEPGDGDMRWAAVAASLAAREPGGAAPTLIRVVEVGLGDGSAHLLWSGSPADAAALYASEARGHIQNIAAATAATPGFACGECKLAGACPLPVQVDGMLGQAGPGNGTRSVSPSELATYGRCPAQWLLHHECHLPVQDFGGGERLERGIAVHDWLQRAHARGTACTQADLPVPGTGLGLAEGLMDEMLYAVCRPFLLAHLDLCPVGAAGAEDVSPEELAVGYDSTADVVVTTRADLVYRLADRLVVRETKTTEERLPEDREEAYDRWPQVGWSLTALRSGLAERRGADGGLVELEVLAPGGGTLFTWATDELGVPAMAAGDVRRAVSGWHTDVEWPTNAAPHCAFCPVRQWCPDRDTFAAGPPPEPGSPEAAAVSAFTDADDPPPF